MANRDEFKKLTKAHSDLMAAPLWSLDKSASQLEELAEIVRDNKTKKERWEAFEASSLPSETKTFFNETLEPCVREFVKAAGTAKLDGELVRWAIGIGRYNRGSYTNLDEFLSVVERYIDEYDMKHNAAYDSYGDIDTSAAEAVGGFLGYAGVFGPIILVALWFMGFFEPSAEELAQRERAAKSARSDALTSCKESLSASIRSSCSADPVFAYCSLNYDSSEILGSGCTSAVKRQGSYSEQVEYCQSKSLSTVNRTCAIQIYGCSAVTGDINC